MRKGILLSVMLACVLIVQAQSALIESEIRNLETAEHQAILKKDTAALHKIWGHDLVVNAPMNRIVQATNNVSDRPVISQMSYSSFTREIEHIQVKGDVVFSMGSEVIVPVGNVPNAGKTVKRRYTNIWMKENGSWKLVARHANVICQ